ncbi:sensor domain-containing diguanylate cyclase [Microbacterium sp. BK668]|uniref:bifunctional diguanylate cyclase/phosphodiesterase n=1 Tax=Microbacterium sp. BK668 TaxID=2512118 RepID=UPI00105F1636|nr:sensor domain-containing diguanylate cyclase [Microbacterium sp. BK668]TDN91406.1 diguanylate cyclase (GGDEF)-like protein [Microbacterium sp. BK668]
MSDISPAREDEREWEIDEQRRLELCAAEPIRTPGRIQGHGTLLGVDEPTQTVVLASENADRWLGQRVRDVGNDTMLWTVQHGVAVDPVRVEFDGQLHDMIVHRGTDPLLVELEPVVPGLEYVRTGVVSAIQELAPLTDPDELRRLAARRLKEITGFDRVMCYHFHPDGHGEIVADEREPDMEPYLGLHFPASDIPSQARALYVEKRSRAIVDTEDAGLAVLSLLPEAPIADLGLTELRAVSPHHLQFMRNMGQASTVSFALVIDGELVGLFTCAHRTNRRLPVLLRRSIEVLASQVSMQLASANEIQRLRRQLEARERRASIVAPLYGRGVPAEILVGGDKTVLDLIPADGAYLRIGDAMHSVGTAPSADALSRILDELPATPFVSDALPLEHPQLAVELAGVAGIVAVPLLDEGDWLVFVRGEVAQHVDWLGDQTAGNREHALSPRRSFSSWQQSVTGRSAPWGRHLQDIVELGEDIRATLAQRVQAELAELAWRDPLTGLHNRRFLQDRLDELLEEEVLGVAVVFLDLDGFKEVNDTHGHEAGDAVLLAVGQRLSASARSSDMVVRWGGDEFVIVCLGVDAAHAHEIAARAVSSLEDPIGVEHELICITASAGVVSVDSRVTTTELLDAADSAMYRAKRAGKGRVSA